jgi:hypothetical protein
VYPAFLLDEAERELRALDDAITEARAILRASVEKRRAWGLAFIEEVSARKAQMEAERAELRVRITARRDANWDSMGEEWLKRRLKHIRAEAREMSMFLLGESVKMSFQVDDHGALASVRRDRDGRFHREVTLSARVFGEAPKHCEEIYRGLVLHELGHLWLHETSSGREFRRIEREVESWMHFDPYYQYVLNIVLDEHLERNLRDLRPSWRRAFNRLEFFARRVPMRRFQYQMAVYGNIVPDRTTGEEFDRMRDLAAHREEGDVDYEALERQGLIRLYREAPGLKPDHVVVQSAAFLVPENGCSRVDTFLNVFRYSIPRTTIHQEWLLHCLDAIPPTFRTASLLDLYQIAAEVHRRMFPPGEFEQSPTQRIVLRRSDGSEREFELPVRSGGGPPLEIEVDEPFEDDSTFPGMYSLWGSEPVQPPTPPSTDEGEPPPPPPPPVEEPPKKQPEPTPRSGGGPPSAGGGGGGGGGGGASATPTPSWLSGAGGAGSSSRRSQRVRERKRLRAEARRLRGQIKDGQRPDHVSPEPHGKGARPRPVPQPRHQPKRRPVPPPMHVPRPDLPRPRSTWASADRLDRTLQNLMHQLDEEERRPDEPSELPHRDRTAEKELASQRRNTDPALDYPALEEIRIMRGNLRRWREAARLVAPWVAPMRAQLRVFDEIWEVEEGLIAGRRIQNQALLRHVGYGELRLFRDSRMRAQEQYDSRHLTVLMDTSASMGAHDRFDRALEITSLIAACLVRCPGARSRFLGFNQNMFLCGDHHLPAFDALAPAGKTNEAAALDFAARKLQEDPAIRKVVVVLSDGLPTACSVASSTAMARRLETQGVRLLYLAMGPQEHSAYNHVVDATSPVDVRFAIDLGRMLQGLLM